MNKQKWKQGQFEAGHREHENTGADQILLALVKQSRTATCSGSTPVHPNLNIILASVFVINLASW